MQKLARFSRLAVSAVLIAFLMNGCKLWKSPTAPETPGNSSGPNRAPVSTLVLPYAAQVGQNVVVQNNATDPDGDAIVAYRFRSPFHDVTQAGPAANLTFGSTGKYAVAVSAKDSRELWSAEVSDTIIITASPPSGRTLFFDDGTLQPIDLGYKIGYPSYGDFSVVTSGGLRTMRYFDGNKSGSYSYNSWMPVPRGAHLKFRMYFNVDADPVWLSAGSSRGYVMLHLVLTNEDHTRHGNYFVLATRDLDSDGFPGSPRRYESNFQPGRDAYDRFNNGWVSMDIDLDELARTRFANATGFDRIWFSHIVLTYPANEPPEYRLTHQLDYLEVYVPAAQ